MRTLSRQQEQRLIDALVALDWMSKYERKSCQVISEQLDCSMQEAMEILGYLYVQRKLIRSIHRGNDRADPGVIVPSYGWRWERRSR